MAYDNSYKLKIMNATTTVSVQHCEKCNINFSDSDKFCSKCGGQLEIKKVDTDNTSNIIADLRKFSDEAKSYLTKKGTSDGTGSGHTIVKDIIVFSKDYPNVVFCLEANWDSGFEEPPTRYYIRYGKVQKTDATYVFEDFDETKLK